MNSIRTVRGLRKTPKILGIKITNIIFFTLLSAVISIISLISVIVSAINGNYWFSLYIFIGSVLIFVLIYFVFTLGSKENKFNTCKTNFTSITHKDSKKWY